MSVRSIHGYLRAVGIDPEAGGASDAELIARFAATGDESAFELLVWRHAPLVQRACRAVLRDHHAAEDAAQATFLVLARKAGTFGGRGSVVGWLHRVARRVSVRLARQHARLPVGAGQLDLIPAAAVAEPSDGAAVWQEVERLPERYRVPVLLCFFEGLTHAEAARRTGLPVGTVAGQLARAKELLAKRLSRRGLVLAGVALPVVAGAFVGSTARAATAFAAGRTSEVLVSPLVLQLAQGAMKSMTATLLKSAAAVLAVGALTATVWAFVPGNAPVVPPELPLVPPVEPVAAPVPKDAGKAGDGIADARQRMHSLNNLKQIMIGLHNYHDAVGHFPNDITDKNGKALLSWRVAVLPYMDQEHLYKEFKLNEPWDSDANKKLLGKMPKVFLTGTEEKGAVKTFYQGIAGPGTAFEPGLKLKLIQVTDGTSNTLGVVEAGPAVEWTKPADISYDPRKAFPKFDGPFRNVVHVATLDGAAYALKPDLKDKVLHELTTRAGGEVIDFDKAKAELKAFTKEEKELAQKLQKENAELARERAELLAELTKLTAELGKKPGNAGPDLDKLLAQQLDLRRDLEALKAEIEALKKGLDKK